MTGPYSKIDFLFLQYLVVFLRLFGHFGAQKSHFGNLNPCFALVLGVTRELRQALIASGLHLCRGFFYSKRFGL